MHGKDNTLRYAVMVTAVLALGALGGCDSLPFMGDKDEAADTSSEQPVDIAEAPSDAPQARASSSDSTASSQPQPAAAPAPLPDGPSRRYHYYPHHEVFYDTAERRYTWYDRGAWRADERLPDNFKLNVKHAMILELPGPHPELSISHAHRLARAKGLVPGQARGAGGAAPDDRNTQAPIAEQPVAPATNPDQPRPESDQPKQTEPQRPGSLF